MNYQEKLKAALELGGFKVSELAYWLEVPRPSLQMWLLGTKPHRATQDKLDRKLLQLERAASFVAGPFIPDKFTQRQRKMYLTNQKAKLRRKELGFDD